MDEPTAAASKVYMAEAAQTTTHDTEFSAIEANSQALDAAHQQLDQAC